MRSRVACGVWIVFGMVAGCGGQATESESADTSTADDSSPRTAISSGGARGTSPPRGGNDDGASNSVTGVGGSRSSGSGGTPAEDATSTSAGPGAFGMACPGETDSEGNLLVWAEARNNYEFSSRLSFPPVSVAPDVELTFDWSALAHDLAGRPLDPDTDIDGVNLMSWKLGITELERLLNDDALRMGDLTVLATLYPGDGETSGALFDFTSAGSAIEPELLLPFVNAENYPPDSNILTVMPASGERLGEGIRMIQSFRLDPDSDNTEVVIHDDSTVVDYEVDLTSLDPVAIPSGESEITFDWSGLAFTGLGGEFVHRNIDRIVVAHYDRSVIELEADFLELIDHTGHVLADEVWEASVASGERKVLASLSGDDALRGIDDSGTWLLGLFCGSCQNRAPWFLTILTPCTAS